MRITHFLSVTAIVASSFSGNSVQAQSVGTYVPGFSQSYTPWERLPEVNISWKKRVWRELDCKDNPRLFTTNEKASDNILPLAEVLMDGIMDGSIQAYNPINDRFTDKMTYDDLLKQIDGYTVINKIIDPATGMKVNECVNKTHVLSAIHQFRIKEDWLTLKDGRLLVRVMGIAPVVNVTDVNGITTEQPLFWVYYPDYREHLSNYFVPATNDNSAPLTWDDFFETRQFNSKATRVVETDYSKLRR